MSTGLNPQRVYEGLVRMGDEWADAHAAAEHFEETRKPLLAKLTLDRMGDKVSKAQAELEAMASPEYAEHLSAGIAARREANKARVRYDAAKIKAGHMQTVEANRRAEMRLAGMG